MVLIHVDVFGVLFQDIWIYQVEEPGLSVHKPYASKSQQERKCPSGMSWEFPPGKVLSWSQLAVLAK